MSQMMFEQFSFQSVLENFYQRGDVDDIRCIRYIRYVCVENGG